MFRPVFRFRVQQQHFFERGLLFREVKRRARFEPIAQAQAILEYGVNKVGGLVLHQCEPVMFQQMYWAFVSLRGKPHRSADSTCFPQ